jgi:hypothetical protein
LQTLPSTQKAVNMRNKSLSCCRAAAGKPCCPNRRGPPHKPNQRVQ